MLSAVLTTVLAVVTQQPTTLDIHLDPSDCDGTDCFGAIRDALNQCKEHGSACNVLLAAGKEFVVRCPQANRTSTTQTESPAVLLDGMTDVILGGAAPGSPAHLLIDYSGGGCAGIVVNASENITIKNLVIDALRLPFTVGIITNANSTTVEFMPEQDAGDRQEVYKWDISTYPWLSVTDTSQVVSKGDRATRELPDVGIANAQYSSSIDMHSGAVSLSFAEGNQKRASLAKGDRLFLKHYNNLESWGIYGFNVSGLAIINSFLWSVSGMGYRCDLCDGHFVLQDSKVEIKPSSVRPMSITADAIHFMHTAGLISIVGSSLQGQGDDGFNVHGNYIVIKNISRSNRRQATYIDETGPGWLTATPTFIVGDTVDLVSRETLEVLGQTAIVSATATEVQFSNPLPDNFKLFDMFLTTKRIAAVNISNSFFGNSNARGALISGVNVTVENNSFVNLTGPAILFFDGGCGAEGQDYTEGPVSKNVLIRNNFLFQTASVDHRKRGQNVVANLGAIQIGGCRPDGQCGISGGLPSPLGESKLLFPESEGSTLRMVPFDVPTSDPSNQSINSSSVSVSGLRYFIGETTDFGPKDVQMAIYSTRYLDNQTWKTCNHPTERLAWVQGCWIDQGGGWWSSPLDSPLNLTNGTYFLAHWYSGNQSWQTASAPGSYISWQRSNSSSADAMPPNLAKDWASWTRNDTLAISIAMTWTAANGWCDSGGSLPPPMQRHVGDTAGGRIIGPGAFVETNSAVFSNIEISDNTFVAPLTDGQNQQNPWGSSFLFIGNVKGLKIANNSFERKIARSQTSLADIVLYSNSGSSMNDNSCSVLNQVVPCQFASSPS